VKGWAKREGGPGLIKESAKKELGHGKRFSNKKGKKIGKGRKRKKTEKTTRISEP